MVIARGADHRCGHGPGDWATARPIWYLPHQRDRAVSAESLSLGLRRWHGVGHRLAWPGLPVKLGRTTLVRPEQPAAARREVNEPPRHRLPGRLASVGGRHS